MKKLLLLLLICATPANAQLYLQPGIPIGTTAGTARDAAAAIAAESSALQQSVLGLSLPLSATYVNASGLNNALSYACGITIGDGATHTVSAAPAGSCFNGITTLAGLAAITIKGTTPFSFLTDSGSVTGPLCTIGATTNCFTASPGAYVLTNSSVANMDIAWLAIQACLLTHRCYIPGGQYYVGTSESLPLMIPQASEANTSAPLTIANRITGDSNGGTVIFAGSSFGQLADGITNIPLLSGGDPGATPTNGLGRWAGNSGQCKGLVQHLNLWGSTSLATGLSSTYHTDGYAHCSRQDVDHLTASWFYRDVTITGDHSMLIKVSTNGGVRGVYWTAPNTALSGDLEFYNLSSSGASMYGVEVDGAATMAGFFKGETYLNAGLFAIAGNNNGCSGVVGNAFFDNFMTEYMSLGVIEDLHNWNGSVYNDANKCRGVSNFNTEHWFNAYNNSGITTGSGMRRRATIDAASLSGRITGIDTNGGNIVPTADNIGAAGIAIFNVATIGDASSNLGLRIDGSMEQTFVIGVGAGVSGATIPLFNSTAVGGAIGGYGLGATWDDPGGDGGTIAPLTAEGTYTTTQLGDVMEFLSGTYGQAAPGGYSINQPIMGIVVQAGLTNGMMMPIQTHGIQYVSAGYHNGNDGFQKKGTGIGGGSVITAAGSGGTSGTYSWTATGGGCSTEPSGSFVVSGGGVTSFYASNSATASGVGCTSTPTVTLTATGLSGAAVTLQWPSANETTASTSADTPQVFSYGLHGGTGSTTGGTEKSYSRLTGMW